MPRNQSNPATSKPQQRPPHEHLPFAPGGLDMNPGDEAPAGTPGTGENVCRACAGKGQLNDRPCDECGGSGYVITGIGGA